MAQKFPKIDVLVAVQAVLVLGRPIIYGYKSLINCRPRTSSPPPDRRPGRPRPRSIPCPGNPLGRRGRGPSRPVDPFPRGEITVFNVGQMERQIQFRSDKRVSRFI